MMTSETMARARELWEGRLELPGAVPERPFIVRHDFDDAPTFLRALHRLCPWWREHHESWIFRGHANEDWQLLPSAHREESWRPYLSSGVRFDPRERPEDDRVKRERALIRRFYQAAEDQGLALPVDHLTQQAWSQVEMQGWPPDYLLPLVALAQHHRVPTRLLDWTREAKVAAYFAATEPVETPSERLAVWALNSAVVDPLQREEGVWSMLVRTVPRASNPNLHAQAAVCTLRRYRDDELTTFDEALSALAGRWMGNDPEPHTLMRKMTLPRTEVPLLVTLLRMENVSALTLFPGFYGVTQELLSIAKLNRDAEFSE